MKVFWRLLLACAVVTLPALSRAQDFPSRPVRLMVTNPPVGPADAIARILGPHLAMGQNIIVDNRSGAGGRIGAEVVAKAAPHGHMRRWQR